MNLLKIGNFFQKIDVTSLLGIVYKINDRMNCSTNLNLFDSPKYLLAILRKFSNNTISGTKFEEISRCLNSKIWNKEECKKLFKIIQNHIKMKFMNGKIIYLYF